VTKTGFSFARFLDTPVNFPTELHEWINRSFVAFRELQLCILMESFRPLFNRACTERDGYPGHGNRTIKTNDDSNI